MWLSLNLFQGSADSNYSQPSSDLSLDDEREALRRETERLALAQLEKARVSRSSSSSSSSSWGIETASYLVMSLGSGGGAPFHHIPVGMFFLILPLSPLPGLTGET